MCLETLNTKEKHKKLVDKLTFPCTMYKVVTKDKEGKMYPAFNFVGSDNCWKNQKYRFQKGLNRALKRKIKTTDKKKEYYSGYHMFKYERDAQNMVKLGSTLKIRKHSIIPVIIEKPEHITASGMERVDMLLGYQRVRDDKRRTVYVVSRMTLKKEE